MINPITDEFGIIKNNENFPAYPSTSSLVDGSVSYLGLSKREHFAVMAMHSAISTDTEKWSNTPHHHAEFAVACADALLAELAKEKSTDENR